ncbi:MAG: CDP-alcohol phosphatidyltransferase family protein [Sinobacteraceae bacterium]|nr:CDP-alcohol phosphatidyltransferase family protein [Nevskiaceae bacterium]
MIKADESSPRASAQLARRPWDARLAQALVRPLLGTWVRPNHLTFLRLFVGLAGIVLIARGSYASTNVGMGLVVVANFLDHADGALARMGNHASRFGHLLDLVVDALITVLLFVAMGVAAMSSPLGKWAVVLGLVAGVAVSAIFYMRMQIEDQRGKVGTKQPQWGGFEIEDVLYLLPLVSLFEVIAGFVLVAAIGASIFVLWVLRDYLSACGNSFAASSRPEADRHTVDAEPWQ